MLMKRKITVAKITIFKISKIPIAFVEDLEMKIQERFQTFWLRFVGVSFEMFTPIRSHVNTNKNKIIKKKKKKKKKKTEIQLNKKV